MRLYWSNKIGQSSYELVLSVFFSFFLHAAFVALALVLYTVVKPRVYLPMSYQVKLVGQPAEAAPPREAAQPAPQPKTEPAPPVVKPQPKSRAAAPKAAKPAMQKSAMP